MIIEEEIPEEEIELIQKEAEHIVRENVVLESGEPAVLEIISDFSHITPELKNYLAEQMCVVQNPEGVIPNEVSAVLRQMANNSYDLYYVKNPNGNMLGFATVFPDDTQKDACYINKVQTAPLHRQKGIAKTLIMKTQENFNRVMFINIIQDEKIKQALNNFYIRLGFRQMDGNILIWNSGNKK